VVETSRKITAKAEVCVTCPTCSHEIPVVTANSLPREFSVLCANCGGRKFYQLAQIHDQKPDAEITGMPARVQFGMKRAINLDETAGQPMPPKSRLSEFASWLLQ
jgi:uncharacterized Zn finger protein (UPF0148 family)